MTMISRSASKFYVFLILLVSFDLFISFSHSQPTSSLPHRRTACNRLGTDLLNEHIQRQQQMETNNDKYDEYKRTSPPVPSPLLIAYASWGQCDDKVITSVRQGANVIIWFSLVLDSKDSKPILTGSLPSISCIANIAKKIRDEMPDKHVLHMVSFGGWNAPLPNLKHTSDEYVEQFLKWNSDSSNDIDGWNGFDGIDWDAEGNDDPKEPKNHVQLDHLKLIGDMSTVLKQLGYIISIAPSQSYLDVESQQFDLNISHIPSWKSEFPYHGSNLYAYFISFYGSVFDWVSLQLYEGWSRANFHLNVEKVPFSSYIQSLVVKMDKGWDIDFGHQLGGTRHVSVPNHKLVIGLANAWTPPYPPMQKFLFIDVDDLKVAWGNVDFAGFMFWTIAEEGKPVSGKPFYLTQELHDIFENDDKSYLKDGR